MLQIIRPINLAIIIVTQCLIYFVVLSGKGIDDSTPPIPFLALTMLIACTVCIAAGGFIINDILDQSADRLNKPEATIIGSNMSVRSGWIYYILVILLGFLFAVSTALQVNAIALLWIYPLAVFLLFAYSRWLKFTSLAGNLVVALFTAFVPFIILFAQAQLDTEVWFMPGARIVLAFTVFSFFINLSREIVKDIEDVEGDKIQGYRSLAISYGVERARVFASINTVILIGLILFWLINEGLISQFRPAVFVFLFLIAPLALTVFKLNTADEKRAYTAISRYFKFIMLAGLLFILFTMNP